MRRRLALPLAAAFALAASASASAHANVSPPEAKAGVTQLFTLAVPTEKAGATTTQIELTPPDGFAIDSFVPAPGWRRAADQTGSGEDVVIHKVTWSGGRVPAGEDAVFGFLAQPARTGRLTFAVRQTYSDGSVVDWTGPESSDAPAPAVEVKSASGDGSSTLAVVAFVIAVAALVAGAVALLLRAGGRDLA